MPTSIRHTLLGLTSLAIASFATASDTTLEAQLAEVTNLQPVCVKTPSIPLRLLNQGVTSGEVKAIVEVSPDGSVSDFFVTASTHEELAKATEKTMRDWEFKPTSETAEDTIQQLFLTLKYTAEGFAVGNADPFMIDRLDQDRFAYAATKVSELDRPLEVEAHVAPAYPESWKAEGLSGDVTLSYYIGSDGHVHVPVLLNKADPRLAAAAMDAVSQWKFAKPTADGHPAFIQVRQTFRFDDATANPAAHREPVAKL